MCVFTLREGVTCQRTRVHQNSSDKQKKVTLFRKLPNARLGLVLVLVLCSVFAVVRYTVLKLQLYKPMRFTNQSLYPNGKTHIDKNPFYNLEYCTQIYILRRFPKGTEYCKFTYFGKKVQFLPLQTWAGPCGFGKLRLQILSTFGTMVVRSSPLRTGRLYPKQFSWYLFLEA
jgi:hypothetical protein